MLSNAQTGIRADQWTAAKEEAKATLTEVAATTEAMARPELSPLRVFLQAAPCDSAQKGAELTCTLGGQGSHAKASLS